MLALLFWQNVLTIRSANDALLNAQAAINSERAYITIEITQEIIGIYLFQGVNYGRTPAEVASLTLKVIFADKEADIPRLIQYSDTEFDDPKILPSNKKIQVGEWAAGRDTPTEEIQSAFDSGKLVILYGRVYYRDILGNPHESRFCRRYTFGHPGLQICGPKGCNQNT